MQIVVGQAANNGGRINSLITLILFEISAMDGSWQHELPIVLY
jgi:hypothetical protein